MNRTVKTIFLSFLMIVLGLSAATNSMNESTETTTLGEPSAPQEVILPANLLNEAGHQEGSIFTDTTLSSGSAHTCAILDNGSVACWGRGGKLGNGDAFNRNTPTLTSSLGTGRTAVAISAGAFHTCAILDNGSVACWGQGGLLGNGDALHRNTPTLTSSLGTNRTAVAISAAAYHTCAILDNGAVSCWGQGLWGKLGNGDTSDKSTPTLTSSLGTNRTAVAITTSSVHTCAILDNGSVACWGQGGKLGNGEAGGTSSWPTNKLTPTLTSSLGTNRTAVAITSGSEHTCIILDNGSVACWGAPNSKGGASNGGTLSPTILTNSLGTNRTAVAISSGETYTCAILDNGTVSCWGRGEYGQLGNGATHNNTQESGATTESTPYSISSLGTNRTAVAISAGGYHICAILDNGSASCWGKGEATGNGDILDKTTPTLISNLGTTVNPRTIALSERDFDNNGTLNIFESTHPSLVTCSAGQYGRYLCVDAPLGKYAPASGAMYATDASAGHYVDSSLGTGQTSQTACLAGTYNPNTSSTDCLDASAGYYVPTTGQSSQTTCAIGTYQSLIGQSSCDDADAGYYVNQINQSSQTQCPTGYTTITIRSTAENQCLSDHDGDTIVDDMDSDDDGDDILDIHDGCPLGGLVSIDADNDGCDDITEDLDDDNDGILDVDDDFPSNAAESVDTDGDGIGDNADMDDDGDNVDDIDDAFPLDASESVDTDGDGIGDNADTDDAEDPNDGLLPGFELWITLLAIIASLFFNRTRRII